jgi:hypothetical protein
MPFPLLLLGAVARVAIPAIIRAVVPRVVSKPVISAATRAIKPTAAAPRTIPTAPKPVTPKPTSAKPSLPKPKPSTTKPTTAKPTTSKPTTPPKTTTSKPTSTASKPTSRVPTSVKRTAGAVGGASLVATIPGSSNRTGNSGSANISPPSGSSNNNNNGPTVNREDFTVNDGGNNRNTQYNDTSQVSEETYVEPEFDPPVYPEPPEQGGGVGGDQDLSDPPPPPIKSAPIDTVLFNDSLVNPEIIADLLFENIGGQEILTIARHDTVNGQSVSYQPIKNLSGISQEYSSESLVKVKGTSKDIFGNFPIKLQGKIPNVGNGPDGRNIYLDADGNIVIEFVNLEGGQEVEVQITSSGTIESIGE